jgi:hypothetical protein
MKLPCLPLAFTVTLNIRTYQGIEQKETIIEAEVISFSNRFSQLIKILTARQVHFLHIVQVLKMRDGDLNDGLLAWMGR